MNIVNIKTLMDTLRVATRSTHEDDPVGFNMDTFTHTCGTPSCIGGYAVALSKGLGEEDDIEDDGGYSSRAAEYLDLTETQASDLFYPNSLLIKWEDITPEMAIKVIENMVETGIVDWSIVRGVS